MEASATESRGDMLARGSAAMQMQKVGADHPWSAAVEQGCSTLPTATAGTRSRLPKAEGLTPEGLMPRWLAPDTFKKMSEAYFPVSGLPSAVSLFVN